MRRLEHRQIAFRFSGEGAKPVFEVIAVGQGYPAPFEREKRAPPESVPNRSTEMALRPTALSSALSSPASRATVAHLAKRTRPCRSLRVGENRGNSESGRAGRPAIAQNLHQRGHINHSPCASSVSTAPVPEMILRHVARQCLSRARCLRRQYVVTRAF
jgi:hypothetical protein